MARVVLVMDSREPDSGKAKLDDDPLEVDLELFDGSHWDDAWNVPAPPGEDWLAELERDGDLGHGMQPP